MRNFREVIENHLSTIQNRATTAFTMHDSDDFSKEELVAAFHRLAASFTSLGIDALAMGAMCVPEAVADSGKLKALLQVILLEVEDTVKTNIQSIKTRVGDHNVTSH
jgi:hypothetical protein